MAGPSPKTNPRVLITHVYSAANNGDATLLRVLIDELRRVFGKPALQAATLDCIDERATFHGVPLERSLMQLALNTFTAKPLKFVYSLYVIGLTITAVSLWRLTGWLWLPRRLRRATRNIIDADIMIPVGGGYLRGRSGIVSFTELLLLLHPIILAKMAGVPVMHHSQSVGPFGSRLQQWLTAHVLRKSDMIAAREDVTMRLLRDMKVPERALVRSVDAGFLFESPQHCDIRQMLAIPPSRRVVGVTVRQWLSAEPQADYELAVAALCDHIIKGGGSVVLIPQVTAKQHRDDDRVPSRRVAHLVRDQSHVYTLNNVYDSDTIKALYGALDMMVGTRFHSVIFALTSYVPAIAIEYEHKTGGIMHDLQLNQWVCNINTVTPGQLIAMYDSLVQNADAYHRTLRKLLPAYARNVHKAADEIAARYYNITSDQG